MGLQRRRLTVFLAFLASASCYAHEIRRDPREPPPALHRLASMHGRYRISRGAREVGEERFTITASTARGGWVAEGEIRLSWPLEHRQGYRLELAGAHGVLFEVWIDLEGERQRARGRTEADYLVVQSEGVGGKKERRIPYVAGTFVDFASPIFNTVPLAEILPALRREGRSAVRTVVLSPPMLEAAVTTTRYVLAGRDAIGERIKVASGGAARPMAMWIRDDGLPLRVRSWVDDGDPFELVLTSTASEATSPAL